MKGLEKKIGYTFKNPKLAEQCLFHRSFTQTEFQSLLKSNERMEFLGDSVLNLVVSNHLYRRFPDRPEGTLSKYKSLIISRKILGQRAAEMDLGQYLYLSKLEEKSGGRERGSIISNAFEAVIAAIYLDGGYAAAEVFISHFLLSEMDNILKDKDFFNYKSILLEHFQGKGEPAPDYPVLAESGPDHNKTFSLEVRVGDQVLGTGNGKTKKEAEQLAARNAMEKLGLAPE